MRALGGYDLLWALGIAGAAVAAFFLFRTPEPARTGLELVAAVCGGAGERGDLIERHVAERLDVSLSEEGERRYSQKELVEELVRLDAVWPNCAFSLRDWRIRPHTARAQWLEGALEYSDSEPSDLHGRRRAMRALFREVEGEQRLERVILGPVQRRLPEARP